MPILTEKMSVFKEVEVGFCCDRCKITYMRYANPKEFNEKWEWLDFIRDEYGVTTHEVNVVLCGSCLNELIGPYMLRTKVD